MLQRAAAGDFSALGNTEIRKKGKQIIITYFVILSFRYYMKRNPFSIRWQAMAPKSMILGGMVEDGADDREPVVSFATKAVKATAVEA